MRPLRLFAILLTCSLLVAFTASCTPQSNSAQEDSLPLASFTQNSVDVSIRLEHTSDDNALLVATYTPQPGYHLYSKDIPRTGVGGLGRPTLLELTSESHMHALGDVVESVPAQTPNFEPKDLWVYPAGAVRLSLPVELPPGTSWVDDTVSVSYMACGENGCKPPVMGKIVSIRVPGRDMAHP